VFRPFYFSGSDMPFLNLKTAILGALTTAILENMGKIARSGAINRV
jgi:hypothetical protein